MMILLFSACDDANHPNISTKPTSTLNKSDNISSTISLSNDKNIIFALLADNRLVALQLNDGKILTESSLAPIATSNLLTFRAAGHFMALSKDNKKLYVLIPGFENQPNRIADIDLATRKPQTIKTLARNDINYRTLMVGTKTGRLYLIGNRAGGVIVTVLDPLNGSELLNWTAIEPDGYEWYVYQAAITEDELELYISYHSQSTTGIDQFKVVNSSLQRCRQRERPNAGCFNSHGGFLLYGNHILATTGEGPVLKLDKSGNYLGGFDLKLEHNHVMEFVVDNKTNRLYAIGSCGYAGGFSAIDLGQGGQFKNNQKEWLTTPAPPKILVLYDSDRPCGERIALSPNGLLVVGELERAVPQINKRGAVQIVEVGTGKVLKKIATRSEPLDLIIATP